MFFNLHILMFEQRMLDANLRHVFVYNYWDVNRLLFLVELTILSYFQDNICLVH